MIKYKVERICGNIPKKERIKAMKKCGLVSISFRKYSPEDILKAMREADLEYIEWGGDVHAPHGNIEECEKIRALTEKYGIKIAGFMVKSEEVSFSAYSFISAVVSDNSPKRFSISSLNCFSL